MCLIMCKIILIIVELSIFKIWSKQVKIHYSFLTARSGTDFTRYEQSERRSRKQTIIGGVALRLHPAYKITRARCLYRQTAYSRGAIRIRV